MWLAPLTLSLGELATLSICIRKRMQMERGRCGTLRGQFRRPFSIRIR